MNQRKNASRIVVSLALGGAMLAFAAGAAAADEPTVADAAEQKIEQKAERQKSRVSSQVEDRVDRETDSAVDRAVGRFLDRVFK